MPTDNRRHAKFTVVHGNRPPGTHTCGFDVWTCPDCSDVHVAVKVPLAAMQIGAGSNAGTAATQIQLSQPELLNLIARLQAEIRPTVRH